jgi:hypothetical protein
MLFGSLFIVFLPVTILITFFSMLSIIHSILTGRIENVFLYPDVEFYPPCAFDIFLAFLVILLIVAAIIILVYLFA